MARTLWEEFAAERWRRRLIIGVLIGVVIIIGLAIRFWPPVTLEDAIRHMKIEEQPRPHALGQPFEYGTGSAWYWVDARRRAGLEKQAGDWDKQIIEVMLRTAKGRPFLYHYSGRLAFINTSKGPVFVFSITTKDFNRLMRDAKSGLTLDLKPYLKTPEVAVVPLDVLAPYVTRQYDGELLFWRFYLVSEADDTPPSRQTLDEPLSAIAFGSGQP